MLFIYKGKSVKSAYKFIFNTFIFISMIHSFF